MMAVAAGLVPYAESVRTNSLEQVTQIATLLTSSRVTCAQDSSSELTVDE
jgi:hypothetical protein